jgi:rRNA processing protein Gar1
MVLLESDGVQPVERPKPLFSSGKKVGRIMETIGRVDSPLYVATLDAGVTLQQLKGKKLHIQAGNSKNTFKNPKR